jgi:beta-lactamase regulating signal transducer with metallopeptidase domain
MIDFIIKSTLSLALLYVVYILMLEREKMHQFNRFYLLFGLLFSLIIPFITFEIYVESRVAVANTVVQPMPFSNAIIAEQTDYLPVILWSIYLIVTVGLLTRFANNLIKIRRKINSNPSEKLQNATLILLNEKVLPHTFLNYIFINRNDYENRKIEEELYTHEQTHVRQKHTLDILFIEILKTIFWFNPLLILYKKTIQLNHEFLADENVVQSYNNVPFYQNLLLEKASWNKTFYLASNLNYLVTKKRLIMMTKTTSQSRALLKKLALVPILTGTIFISCSEIVTEKQSDEKFVVSTWDNAKALSSERSSTNKTEVEVIEVDSKDVPTKPEFPGGLKALLKFVAQEIKIPEGYKGNGKVILSFVVTNAGTLEGIKVIDSPDFVTGEEAERMMKTSPKWKPGLKDGKPVRVQFYLPIQLDLK